MSDETGQQTTAEHSLMNRVVRVALLLALGTALYTLNRSGAVEAALGHIEALGPWAPLVFVVLHMVSVVVLVPSLAPNFAAGALFGVVQGLPLTLLGAGLGAVAAFGLGRTVARAPVERRFANDARFRALSKLTRERGWKIVALARLTPIFPFSIGNYAFGVERFPPTRCTSTSARWRARWPRAAPRDTNARPRSGRSSAPGYSPQSSWRCSYDGSRARRWKARGSHSQKRRSPQDGHSPL
jgi:uncharacterized membrane protein YdjX (TVP38/TMEM64 family)